MQLLREPSKGISNAVTQQARLEHHTPPANLQEHIEHVIVGVEAGNHFSAIPKGEVEDKENPGSDGASSHCNNTQVGKSLLELLFKRILNRKLQLNIIDIQNNQSNIIFRLFMQLRRQCKNTSQLEFTALVEAAEIASRELVERRRAQRHLVRAQKEAVRLLDPPKGSKHGFDRTWMDAVVVCIEQSATLKEGIVFAASRLSELLDLGIKQDGEDPEWREKYDAFCNYKKSMVNSSSEEINKMTCACWELAEDLFAVYYSLNATTEWSLLEHFCSGKVTEDLSADFLAKQANCLKHCAEVVWWIHLLITNVAPSREGGDERSSKT